MRISFRAADLRTVHFQSAVRFFDDFFFRDWFGETGPGAAVEFVERNEKWLTGNDINLNPGRAIGPMDVVERSSVTFPCAEGAVLAPQLLPSLFDWLRSPLPRKTE